MEGKQCDERMRNEMELSNGYVKSADEHMKEAQEWLQKVEQLEKQYQEELTAAGDDEVKKNEVIRRIADEVGMIPAMASGVMNRPIVSLLNIYFHSARRDEPGPAASGGSWICKMCETENDGIFCKACGAKRP